MTTIMHLGPNDPLPNERHVAVVVHRDHMAMEKAYFFDSAERDHGGSGPFDWRMSEAIERAEKYAINHGIHLVAVRTKRS